MAEGTFEKSFIPQSDAKNVGRTQTPSSISNMVGGGIFFLTALCALGVFLYGQYIDSSNQRLTQDLSAAAESIDRVQLQNLQAFDARLQAVNRLLSGHNAPSHVLSSVGATTLSSIQFTSFVFEDRGGRPFVTITGTAPDFTTVAAQIGVLKANQEFQEALVSDLSVQQTQTAQNVSFVIEAELDKALLAYTPQPFVSVQQPVDEDGRVGGIEEGSTGNDTDQLNE